MSKRAGLPKRFVSRMRSQPQNPLLRIWIGVALISLVFVTAVIGFRIAGYGWIESVWMTTITISTVGYSESSQAAPGLQLFMVLVIIVGISASAYAFGGFFHFLLEGELQRALGSRRMTRDIGQLQNHVIICGFGRIGEILVKSLEQSNRSTVVVDYDTQRIEEASRQDFLYLIGNATEDQVLLEAGILRAAILVSALPNDADNVFIALTAKSLAPSIRVISRAEHPTSESKLRQAGADKVVLPAVIGANWMERMITRPSTAHIIELMGESSFHDLDLDEFILPQGNKMIGLTVGETESHRRHRLLIAAIKQADGQLLFNPDASYVYLAGDTLIVMGHAEDIQRFQAEFQLLR